MTAILVLTRANHLKFFLRQHPGELKEPTENHQLRQESTKTFSYFLLCACVYFISLQQRAYDICSNDNQSRVSGSWDSCGDSYLDSCGNPEVCANPESCSDPDSYSKQMPQEPTKPGRPNWGIPASEVSQQLKVAVTRT